MKFTQAFLSVLATMAVGVKADAGCSTGAHIIDVRGEGDHPQFSGFGITIELVDQIKKLIPGSSAVAISYPKVGTPPEDNTYAVQHMKRHIKEYARRCPNHPIVLTGYSEGAGITMNTICGTLNPGWNFTWPLDPKYEKHIAAIVTYGDWTHAAHQPFNRGACRVSSPWPRLHNQFCHRWTSKLRSYCNADDRLCCSSYTGRDLLGHHTYFKLFDPSVAVWVRGQVSKFKRLHARSEFNTTSINDEMA